MSDQQQEVAQALGASGLFGKTEAEIVVYRTPEPDTPSGDPSELVTIVNKAIKPWPTADQAYKIIDRLRFEELVITEGYLEIREEDKSDFYRNKKVVASFTLEHGITHALNALLAWATKNLKAELEAAVKEVEL